MGMVHSAIKEKKLHEFTKLNVEKKHVQQQGEKICHLGDERITSVYGEKKRSHGNDLYWLESQISDLNTVRFTKEKPTVTLNEYNQDLINMDGLFSG